MTAQTPMTTPTPRRPRNLPARQAAELKELVRVAGKRRAGVDLTHDDETATDATLAIRIGQLEATARRAPGVVYAAEPPSHPALFGSERDRLRRLTAVTVAGDTYLPLTPADQAPVPNYLLRSALFSLATSYPAGQMLLSQPVWAGPAATLAYTGLPLTPHDLRVFTAVLSQYRETPLGVPLQLTLSELVRLVGGSTATGGTARGQVLASLQRLALGHVHLNIWSSVEAHDRAATPSCQAIFALLAGVVLRTAGAADVSIITASPGDCQALTAGSRATTVELHIVPHVARLMQENTWSRVSLAPPDTRNQLALALKRFYSSHSSAFPVPVAELHRVYRNAELRPKAAAMFRFELREAVRALGWLNDAGEPDLEFPAQSKLARVTIRAPHFRG